MLSRKNFSQLIDQADFHTLFITELGWNRYRGHAALPTISVDGVDYNITSIAERSGFQVLSCPVDAIPTQSVARKIDTKLRRQAMDYICIFRLASAPSHHLWVVPVRSNEKRDLVLVEYAESSQAEFLYSKLDGLTFALDEQTNIVDLRAKVQSAFAVNSEKITKDFYSGFRKEHDAFAQFITGIDDHISDAKKNKNKQWYASVMLNRLMFCYFIQKKGFLDLDADYLSNKLRWIQQERGDNRFFKTFYKGFLSALFHDGLNSPTHDSSFEKVYGKIPYLNGGMFDTHQLERDYADIDIQDEAFERLFRFFDTWRWHLDTRLTATGRDINPDVLGYIFEQYINDRAQMGAYYTKEDITEYIGRNCILPFLFDRVASAKENATRKFFTPDGYVWQVLQRSGDRYIFDAVKHGYTPDWRNRLPADIACGLITPQMRSEYAETPVGDLPDDHTPLATLRARWNDRTPQPWGLPTEIWRETIDRLSRCDDLLGRIAGGNITNVNDFITYNLDIRSFALDLLANGDHLFVKRFYEALRSVTILDPTCGSGAFLFAAMNILEPLYEQCIERMQESAESRKYFKDQLRELESRYRSNIQYFIYKSIILRNLYGVDIMPEAVEIAKLRLFLKMVAVVDVDRRAPNLGLDPLPDIDFNIRCGNTLVGYANAQQLEADLDFSKKVEGVQTDFLQMNANDACKKKIEDDMRKVADTYKDFCDNQLRQTDDAAAFSQAKADLRARLAALNDQLNRRLFTATQTDNRTHDATAGADIFTSKLYADWLTSHQPFHWLAEFYQIIVANGGFDVIIGNPPYVSFSEKSLKYSVRAYNTFTTGNLFAICVERFEYIASSYAYLGYIIPLSGMSIDGFEPLQKIIYPNHYSWDSFYSGDRNPSELFTGVKIRAGIHISKKVNHDGNKYVCRYLKFFAAERNVLFTKINYTLIKEYVNAPKIPSIIGKNILSKINSQSIMLASMFHGQDKLYYHAAPIYWCKCLSDIDSLVSQNLNIADSYKPIKVEESLSNVVFSIINSSLFFYYWIVNSDCYNLTKKYFRIKVPSQLSNDDIGNLSHKLNEGLQRTMQIAEYSYKNRGRVRFAQFFPKLSKPIIDEIDGVLAAHYGFTEEELDFIVNYDIKYRMGDELTNSDE